ncbi:hypothetical protein INT48_003498 [Thamnidium elegans]|uniref:Uncharacterized protein n=1 Tax=Thamnidium elegans TaxID=101142 RepID=A0A8H7SKA0_9FUNG|nr:hypothetical protein INT48_003498 [Thamnidium elegans]
MGKFAISACYYIISNADINDIFNHIDITGYCGPTKVSIASVGKGIDLYYLRFKETGEALNCMVMENISEHNLFICCDPLPRSTAVIMTTATTTTITTTTTATTTTTTAVTVTTTATTTTTTITTTILPPSPSCTTGYLGKNNGKEPTKACCSHINDCKDSCVKGVCGTGVATPITTTKPGSSAPTCTTGHEGKTGILNSSTTKTATKTATKTTSKKPATTCAVDYKGKRNGQDPTKSCCFHSDDCKDTCVNGTSGKHP